MPIPTQHQERYIYHFTHLDNLTGLIRNGLISSNEQKRLNTGHKSIALQDIQNRRAAMAVPSGPGGVVHDYVPFYFCSLSSMLLSVINAKNVDQMHLIYLALPISIIDREEVVFTDAAANTIVPPRFFNNSSELAELDWTAIDSARWSLGTEKNQARMAEVLIHGSVGIDEVDHIVVWGENTKTIVKDIFSENNLKHPEIILEGGRSKWHYFRKFFEKSDESLVAGPHQTKIEFQKVVEDILKTNKKQTARFENLEKMLQALRNDLESLLETAELVGLESENEVHKENVGNHTLSVVRRLTDSEEFHALDAGDKVIVELAAFLHDIGKGPKSRWAKNKGKQKVDPDHPIKSAKMLTRILTEEVSTINANDVSVLVKLVCYHDLVGDILGKGRDPKQLEDISESEKEFSMLIALGMADMRAVSKTWYDDNKDKVPELRKQIEKKFESG